MIFKKRHFLSVVILSCVFNGAMGGDEFRLQWIGNKKENRINDNDREQDTNCLSKCWHWWCNHSHNSYYSYEESTGQPKQVVYVAPSWGGMSYPIIVEIKNRNEES